VVPPLHFPTSRSSALFRLLRISTQRCQFVVVTVEFVVKELKLKRHIIYLSLVLSLVLISCSKSSSSNSPVGGGDGPTVTTIPTVTVPTSDPYGEEVRNSTAIDLADKVNYSGLIDITGSGGRPGNINAPLVGDARVRFRTTNTRSQSIQGKLFLSFEDQDGFWAAEWASAFPGTGVQTSTTTGKTVDIIFADDDLVVRTQGVVVNQNFFGALYYRLRQPGENACRTVTVTCTVTYPWGTYSFVPADGQSCPGYSTTADTVTPCRNYMNTSNSQVKRLGNFTTPFSNISVLVEGQ